jgi:hypothetical protein
MNTGRCGFTATNFRPYSDFSMSAAVNCTAGLLKATRWNIRSSQE